MEKIKVTVKTHAQRLFIILELFDRNGLANHAAAGAYGFFLSLAPLLLLITSFLLVVFKPSPQEIAALVGNIPFSDIIYDEHWLSINFLSISQSGIPGIISALSVFWAGRILLLSVQRGLRVIFPGTKSRNPLIDTLVTLAAEVGMLLFVLLLILGSQTALRFYRTLNFFTDTSSLKLIISVIRGRFFFIVLMGIVAFFIYRFMPANSPKKLSAFWGALFLTLTYGCTTLALGILIDQSNYNFIYGTLGSLVILLVNVYFFFIFFFLGAQVAYVDDSFDALLFSKLRHTRSKAGEKKSRHEDALEKLFFSTEGNLNKYFRTHKKGEIIFSQGDTWDDIYYLLEGEVEVNILSSRGGSFIDTLTPGSFFGEMGYLLSEQRSATVSAKTDISALALPPSLFEEILNNDTGIDRAIIEYMSRKLKNTNEQVTALKSDIS
ncbi:MAG: YihY/virulence factor BrkB family protein [Treponema sp.]|jgi:membrane protein|nr:YihY/virulence factor BrkB family protein [Treponema sp.]